MYDQDPIVNDIVLTVVNDGNGDQCGASYQDRCRAIGAENEAQVFDYAAYQYGRVTRRKQGSKPATHKQCQIAAALLHGYYVEHVQELG